MKIYVASSWRNEYQQAVVEILRSSGFEVYDFMNPGDGLKGFAWSDIDEFWQNWSTKDYCHALNHPVAVNGFNADFDAMKWADCCIMILPCGRSAHTEAGWMKGAGKKVYIYQPEKQEPELMYKIHDGIFANIRELLFELKKENEK